MIRVAVDWGSSSFRAYCFDAHGEHLETRASAKGIKFIDNGAFEAYLHEVVGDWLQAGDSVLLSGMITSRNGWFESDYLSCPANLNDLIGHSRTHQQGGIRYLFLPGVSQQEPADVMRGEELQLLGAQAVHGSGLYVIPGTHSKWAWLDGGTIQRFRTIPTGEMFDLVVNRSLMGALTEADGWDAQAFEAGVSCGYDESVLVSNLFSARSRVLLGQQSGAQAYAWLSGLLIGNEVREALTLTSSEVSSVTLVGAASLCAKYATAIQHLGFDAQTADDDVTLDAFHRVIQSIQETES